MDGTFDPMYSSNNIWIDTDMNSCLTNNLEDIESGISSLQTGKANLNHVHTEYAPISHTHSDYATTSHKHSASDITSGTLPISKGGTGASTVNGILTNLGNIGKVYSAMPNSRFVAKWR